MDKQQLSKDQIKQGLDMLSMNPYRIKEATTETVKEGDDDFCMVTFKVALDKIATPEPAIANS